MTESRQGYWCILAFTFLALGALCYLLGRAPGSALLMPQIASLESVQGSLVGWFPGWLPTYTHTAAFVLLSAVAWPGTHTRYLVYAVVWIAINVAFEFLQWPGLLAAALGSTPWTEELGESSPAFSLLSSGSFDPNDIAAAVAGGLTGFFLLITTQGDKNENP